MINKMQFKLQLYLINNDKQNYPFCRLKLLVEILGYYLFSFEMIKKDGKDEKLV